MVFTCKTDCYTSELLLFESINLLFETNILYKISIITREESQL